MRSRATPPNFSKLKNHNSTSGTKLWTRNDSAEPFVAACRSTAECRCPSTPGFDGGVAVDRANRLDALGLDFFDDLDAAIAGVIGDKAANLASVKAQLGFSFNIAAQIARMAFSLVPGTDAVLLIGKLTKGDDITLYDIAAAGLSATIVGTVIVKTFKALRAAKNARKIA